MPDRVDSCQCGARKQRKSKTCRECYRESRKDPSWRLAEQKCPGCGGYKYRYSERCRRCADKLRRQVINPRLDRREVPDATLIAWAAGFFEGEGSVNGHGGTLHVSMGQKERWPLEMVQRYFGGSIYRVKPSSSRFGDAGYVLSMTGAIARRFMEQTEGWLSPRRLVQLERARQRDSGEVPDARQVA